MQNQSSTPKNHTPETDLEMLKRIGLKFFILVLIINLFDFLIDIGDWLLDTVIEILHIVIEIIEQSLEEIIEHLLHSSHHETETIIANATIIIGLFIAYRSVFYVYRRSVKIKRNIKARYLKRRHRNKYYWHALTTWHKTKIILTYITGFSLIILTL